MRGLGAHLWPEFSYELVGLGKCQLPVAAYEFVTESSPNDSVPSAARSQSLWAAPAAADTVVYCHLRARLPRIVFARCRSAEARGLPWTEEARKVLGCQLDSLGLQNDAVSPALDDGSTVRRVRPR